MKATKGGRAGSRGSEKSVGRAGKKDGVHLWMKERECAWVYVWWWVQHESTTRRCEGKWGAKITMQPQKARMVDEEGRVGGIGAWTFDD